MPSPGPDFLVIGAAKSGTTSLCHYLRQHPSVFVARQKESHHFLYPDAPPRFTGPGDDTEYNALVIADRDRYEACFARAAAGQVRGEASVYYLYEPEALRRALEHAPGMKFVAVLREPAERAFSAWSHKMRDGREPEPRFLAAVDDEQRRAALGWSYGFRYDSVGCYGAQLQAALTVVPAAQLHVLLYEDLVERTDETLRTLFAFLGVDDAAPVDSSLVMNASGRPRLGLLNSVLTRRSPVKEGLKRVLPYRLISSASQQLRNWNLRAVPMPDQDRATLRDRYADDVAQLSRLLDRDLSGWQRRRP